MLLKFSLYSDEELIEDSILISKKNELTDNTTSYTLNPQLPCKQCKLIIECPGHIGRIPLYHRIVHPLFVNSLCKEITRICPICKKYNELNTVKTNCCKKRIIPTTFSAHKIKVNKDSDNKTKFKNKNRNKGYSEYGFTFNNKWLSIDEMYQEILCSDFSSNISLKEKLLNVFIRNIPVLPINMRPSIVDSNNAIIHSNITSIYIRILDLNHQYQNEEKFISKNMYILRSYNLFKKVLGIRGINDSTEDADRTFIKQMLSGKNGIFRSMCLAKRQNFCLRSVIVPNIDIPLDVVLIPKIFTEQLIPYGYKPYDYVIINRQPTLQTTSLLAVHSYPSNSRTIQINPLIANMFQADFDGDEMNIFWLPGEDSKRELASKLNIAKNIRSYKNAALMIKFIQDTLTGIYNMTRDRNNIDPVVLQSICKKLNISNKKWLNFCKFYKSRMNTEKIPYCHLLSILIPRTLTIHDKNNLMVDRGILLEVVNGDNQTVLLNSIINYGNDFYLKFMWDVQRMVHEYNLFHIITISIADCIPTKPLYESMLPILSNISSDIYSIPLSNIDSLIITKNKPSNKRENLKYYRSLVKLIDHVSNNLTNIINSGSKGNSDNIVQILMSIGIPSILPNYFIKNSYSDGLSARELFIHSKSGRVGIISTSLSTSSTGYLQRELVKSMEDLVVDKNGMVYDYEKNEIYYYPFATNTPNIDDNFLEYAFAMSNL